MVPRDVMRQENKEELMLGEIGTFGIKSEDCSVPGFRYLEYHVTRNDKSAFLAHLRDRMFVDFPVCFASAKPLDPQRCLLPQEPTPSLFL